MRYAVDKGLWSMYWVKSYEACRKQSTMRYAVVNVLYEACSSPSYITHALGKVLWSMQQGTSAVDNLLWILKLEVAKVTLRMHKVKSYEACSKECSKQFTMYYEAYSSQSYITHAVDKVLWNCSRERPHEIIVSRKLTVSTVYVLYRMQVPSKTL